MLTPTTHRIGGHSPRQVGHWIGFFCLVQLLVSPLAFFFTVLVAESSGIPA